MTLQEDLNYASTLGVNMCGFIFASKSSRYVEPTNAALLSSYNMLRVGVFVTHDTKEIKDTVKIAKLDLIQLHGKQGMSCIEELVKTYNTDNIIYALWPDSYNSYEELHKDIEYLSPYVSMFLFDGGFDGGGSGKEIKSELLGRLTSEKKWLLAGGLNHLNVGDAIKKYKPYGVDLNSGVEKSAGNKDKTLMYLAVQNVMNCKVTRL